MKYIDENYKSQAYTGVSKVVVHHKKLLKQ